MHKLSKKKLRKSLHRTFAYRLYRFYKTFHQTPGSERINIVVISGVAKGLGRLLSIFFHKEGYTVIGIDIKPSGQLDDQTKTALTEYIQFDLGELEGIEEMLNGIIKKHERIDLLINNAGILNFKLLHHYTVDEIKEMVNVNLTSVMIMIKCILPHMINRGFGRIINISSNSAFEAEDKFGVYSPTKAGVMMLSDAVARLIDNKLSGSITINSVNPQRINTPEYLSENPDVKESSLIPPAKVFRMILRIVKSEVNGGTFTIIRFRFRITYFLHFFQRMFLPF